MHDRMGADVFFARINGILERVLASSEFSSVVESLPPRGRLIVGMAFVGCSISLFDEFGGQW